MHTTNGGQSWEPQGDTLYNKWDLEFFALEVIDRENIWALAAKNFPSQTIHLAHTEDGGTTWQRVDTGITVAGTGVC